MFATLELIRFSSVLFDRSNVLRRSHICEQHQPLVLPTSATDRHRMLYRSTRSDSNPRKPRSHSEGWVSLVSLHASSDASSSWSDVSHSIPQKYRCRAAPLTALNFTVGRVKLMIWGAALLCIGQILLAAGVAHADKPAGGYVAAVGLYLFLTVFSG